VTEQINREEKTMIATEVLAPGFRASEVLTLYFTIIISAEALSLRACRSPVQNN